MSYYVDVIADYGTGDLAFAEVKIRLRALLREHMISLDVHSVPAFDTISTGFCLAQLACNSPLKNEHLFYVNTAPRTDDKSARKDCDGEGLVYARLNNGVQIVAVNSRHAMSFVKPNAETIRAINIATTGSQFRSRDIFPMAFDKIARGDMSLLGDDITDKIPDMPQNCVVFTDGYGNLKTSINPDVLENMKDQDVMIKINGKQNKAKVTRDIFSVAEGEMVFARGSSGWDLPNGGRQSFVECVLRGGSASKLFDKPKSGAAVDWDKM